MTHLRGLAFSRYGVSLVGLALLLACCTVSAFQYRDVTGSTNNRGAHAGKGATGAQFGRLLPHLVSYSDGTSTPVGGPNARDIVSPHGAKWVESCWKRTGDKNAPNRHT